MKTKDLVRSVLCEFLCSFLFISVILTLTVNMSRSDDPVLSRAILPGIVVAFVSIALLYIFGDLASVHFNPAVTFGMLITRKISLGLGFVYIFAQLLAAILASLLQYVIHSTGFQDSMSIADAIVVIKPETTSVLNAIFMEAYLTFILVYVIFAAVVDESPEPKVVSSKTADVENANVGVIAIPGLNRKNMHPIIIGLTLGFLCYLGGSSSGGCFNIARAFGPALVSNNWENHWIYWVGDFLGAGSAATLHTFVFARKGSLLAVA